MALSDMYKKRRQQIASERERLAIERARSSVQRIMESEQWKLSALALPNADMAVDKIISESVKTVLDPVAQLTDTLRAKGFRPAEIRRLVHDLYSLYRLGPDDGNVVYEDMLKPVADYVAEHQELYNTFDPEQLRDST